MQICIFFKAAWEHFNLILFFLCLKHLYHKRSPEQNAMQNTTALPNVLNWMFNGNLGNPAALWHVDSPDTGTDPTGKRKEVVM